MNAEGFFNYARERYQILLNRRAGLPKPWTDDPILQSYRFCNVFREDDTTTQFIRKHVTYEDYGERLVVAMVIARWFNRISTIEKLLPNGCGQGGLNDLLLCWDHEGWAHTMREVLKNQQPLVTGAYMIKTPAKMTKLEGLIWCIQQFCEMWKEEQHADGAEFPSTLEDATSWLKQSPFLGPFMSYEIVTDLRHSILSKAPDIMTWANPGPGANRGASLVAYGHPNQFKSGSKQDREEMLAIMQDLLSLSQKPTYWPSDWPKWEMREVEHTLCEVMKYTKAQEGKRLKQKYDGNGSYEI